MYKKVEGGWERPFKIEFPDKILETTVFYPDSIYPPKSYEDHLEINKIHSDAYHRLIIRNKNTMAKTTYKLSGMCKWAKVHQPDDKYGNYQICLYMDKKAEKIFVQSGCQGQIKEDEDGRFYNFKRRPQVLSRKGKLLDFGPPKVYDKDGKETDVSIGNGSEVTVEIETYMTEKGVGTRLNSVTINKLVEYKPKDTEVSE